MVSWVWFAFGGLRVVGALAPLDLGDEYTVRSYSVDEGLPQNSVTRITQTPDGYLWFSTYRGLVRFDGVRFTVFDRSNTRIIDGQDSVNTFFKDSKGRITVEFKGGQLVWVQDGVLTRGLEYGLPKQFPSIRGESPDGRRYFENPSTGIWYVESEGGRYEETRPIWGDGKRVGDLTSLHIQDGGIPWIRLDGQWVQMVLQNLVHLVPGPSGKVRKVVQAVASREGGAWLVSDWGIHRIKDGRFLAEIPFPEPIGDSSAGLEDRDGNLWIGSWVQGLWRYSPDGGIQRFALDRGAPSEPVRSLFEDSEGNIWMGMEGSGLHRLRRRAFRTARTGSAAASSITRSVAEDTVGRIWFAGQEGVSVMDPTAGSKSQLILEQALCRSVFCDSSGTIWAGTYSGMIHRIDPDRGLRAEPLEMEERRNVAVLFEEPGLGIWVGREDGLSRIVGNRLMRVPLPVSQEDSGVRAMALDSRRRLWLGLDGGGLLVRESGDWSRFPLPGLPERLTVSALLVDSDQTVWVAVAAGGLVRIRDGQAKRLHPGDAGLPKWPSGFVEDRHGHLWIGSSDGVYRVERSILNGWADGVEVTGVPRRFGREDGMETSECSAGIQPSVVRSRGGQVWFATFGGVAVVDPDRLPPSPSPPRARIEVLEYGGSRRQTVFLSGDADRVVSPGAPPIGIPTGSQSVELRYTAPRFMGTEQLRFRYRLTGLESEWNPAGSRRVASYQGLPPGDYRFEVAACNEDGVWGPPSPGAEFRILPRFHQTWWFRGGVLLALLGVAAAAYNARIRGFTRENLARKAFSQRLIDSQEAERQRIARELHDSLGQNLLVIRNRLALAQQHLGNPERVAEQLREAADVASGSVREVREISQNLRPFQLDELGLERALSASLQRIASSSAIQIRWSLSGVGEHIPRELGIHLFRIVQECVNNVVKHSHAATCEVLVSREPGRVLVEIVDDGCGFDLEQTEHDRAIGGGNGLSNIRERARLLGGSVDIRTAATFGTRIVLVVPDAGNVPPDAPTTQA
jgi:signal transduction histidine kinase/ligand-binding sensor domain-containing protein